MRGEASFIGFLALFTLMLSAASSAVSPAEKKGASIAESDGVARIMWDNLQNAWDACDPGMCNYRS